MESKAVHFRPINNAIYSQLGDRWYDAKDDPIALLRAESRLRNPWIASELGARFGRLCQVLDLGCGAGFLSNDLAKRGHHVTGVDASVESLAVAARRDPTKSVAYHHGDVTRLPYADARFEAVCAMDLLEHVEEPATVIAEASRVLVPGGVLFFHTFNRNWLSWLVVIKGVERFVRNTPKDLHVSRLFLRPDEVTAMCRHSGFIPGRIRGMRPRLDRPFVRMLVGGTVSDDFAFTFCDSTLLAYTGMAIKRPQLRAV